MDVEWVGEKKAKLFFLFGKATYYLGPLFKDHKANFLYEKQKIMLVKGLGLSF